jgi:outer membrane protein
VCKNILIIISFTSFIGITNAEDLSEIYSLALDNDQTLKMSKQSYSAAKERAISSKANLLPQLTGEGSWRKSETDSSTHFSNPFAISPKFTVGNESFNYSITLTQALFDLRAYHEYGRVNISKAISKVEFEETKQDLLFQVADKYLQILAAQAKVDTTIATETAFLKQYDSVKSRFLTGTARIAELNEIQASTDLATATKYSAQTDLLVLIEELSIMTNRQHTEITGRLSYDFVATPPIPLEYQQWVNATNKNNFDIHLSELKVKEAGKNYKAQKAKHLPTLYAGLGYSKSTDDRNYNYSLPDQFNQDGWNSSITLNVPLYSGGRDSASSREANYIYLRAKDSLELMKRKTLHSLKSSYFKVTTGVQIINANKKSIASSNTSLSSAKAEYLSGIGSLKAMLDAQKDLYRNQQEYISSLYAYFISGLELKKTAGLLSVNDINQLSRQLK